MNQEVLNINQDFLKRLKLVINAYPEKQDLLENIWKLTRIRDVKIKKNEENELPVLTEHEFFSQDE